MCPYPTAAIGLKRWAKKQTTMKPEWERASKDGDATTLAALIATGADVDALDRFGQSALMLAAQRGHLEAVHVLIARIA